MMEQWYALEQIIRSTLLQEGSDSLVWQYEAKGEYTTGSLYNIINFRGVQPVYIPEVSSIRTPPKVQVFLWLLSHNKLMNKDNLAKRGIEKAPECVYCSEKESTTHLFFKCVVPKQIWAGISDFLGVEIGTNYLSIARFWPADKKHIVLNSVCACILWTMWKNRNSHVFNNAIWTDVKQIWRRMLGLVRRWLILFEGPALAKMQTFVQKISCTLEAPFQILAG
ncbi:unnamed protein product [Triticum aestivum]|uniref:Reverse transcriptase zinc-binding domain-containing protein n=1 Tax=Triticum aestivum TaxID=4565 RepID=A0A7H4LK85_WHEAT|nr:unnamed protein product [Triticum aestivum]